MFHSKSRLYEANFDLKTVQRYKFSLTENGQKRRSDTNYGRAQK